MFNKKNVYGMEFVCSNCDEMQTVKIRKGMSVSKFMITKKAECKKEDVGTNDARGSISPSIRNRFV